MPVQNPESAVKSSRPAIKSSERDDNCSRAERIKTLFKVNCSQVGVKSSERDDNCSRAERIKTLFKVNCSRVGDKSSEGADKCSRAERIKTLFKVNCSCYCKSSTALPAKQRRNIYKKAVVQASVERSGTGGEPAPAPPVPLRSTLA